MHARSVVFASSPFLDETCTHSSLKCPASTTFNGISFRGLRKISRHSGEDVYPAALCTIVFHILSLLSFSKPIFI
ncbi:hypothetical protein BDQ12DRAFT_685625 [Crucibulum laeve]|uniref:Uncharacterized protein n=1 Tax=Crucibulum laeve TaxID=68775 RepID=A0A5C3LYU9_9AGAR|nr:hypothetical protein BDQ12DRAFT_685625 [Crucibulum laeve]